MSINFALGLAFGQKLAERAGVADPDARRRAGIVLGVGGMTPIGLLVTKTMIDRQAELERKQKDEEERRRKEEEEAEEARAKAATMRTGATSGSAAEAGPKPSGSESGRSKPS